jgi:hypothetical protein
VLWCAEVRSGDLVAPLQLATGDKVVFTIVEGADGTDNRIGGESWQLLSVPARYFWAGTSSSISCLCCCFKAGLPSQCWRTLYAKRRMVH